MSNKRNLIIKDIILNNQYFSYGRYYTVSKNGCVSAHPEKPSHNTVNWLGHRQYIGQVKAFKLGGWMMHIYDPFGNKIL